MADKAADDADNRPHSPTAQFAPVALPLKDKLTPPDHRPVRAPTPTTASTGDVPPPSAKEGYDYWTHLPYEVEDDATRIAHLNEIIGDLYISIRAGDFESGAKTASRQIRQWTRGLKFKMPKDTRKKLAKLYYELSLTPGMDPSAADHFAKMFTHLAKYFLARIWRLTAGSRSCLLMNSHWTGDPCTASYIDVSFVQTATLLLPTTSQKLGT
jgi:Proteasome-substrate-size regulator, N-terminal